jgi:predicted metal-dependent phosphoesterase TrpH
MQLRIDLHVHTNCSDGHYSPEEIVTRAKSRGLNTISIVDHDSVSGLEEAIFHGDKIGLNVIPGIEISTDIEGREVHLLGYFIDYEDKEFLDYLKFFKKEREFRAIRIVNKLQNLGLKINFEDVKEIAGNSTIARPHIAFTMVKLGLVKDYYAAFRKYLYDNGPAYERKIHFSPSAAIKLINDTGGLSFIAHPNNMKESVLRSMLDSGIDGIEVVHPSHSAYRKKFYTDLANHYCVLKSGGSDFHGGEMGDENNLGKFTIPPHFILDMKRALVRNSA